jgi:hypothetical protein
MHQFREEFGVGDVFHISHSKFFPELRRFLENKIPVGAFRETPLPDNSWVDSFLEIA